MILKERYELNNPVESGRVAVEASGMAWLAIEEDEDGDRTYARLGHVGILAGLPMPGLWDDLRVAALNWDDATRRAGEMEREQAAAYREAKGAL